MTVKCDSCGRNGALPLPDSEGNSQNYCRHCAERLGKYNVAFAQLDQMVGDALSKWLLIWGDDEYTCDLGEHLGAMGDRAHRHAAKPPRR